jgi:hypothetical protein
MRYKDHILRAMNTDVEHLNLKENMLMNRTRCLILISLLVGMFAQAQTSSIKGIVTDVKTIPVEYANVILYDAADSTKIVKAATTDVKGRFELSKIPHGSYRLYASCVGYVGTHIRIHNIQEHIKDLPIVLEEQTVALDETTVTAQRVVMEFDRQIIYPGKQEKETAIDGIDLVDKLQLHGIVVGKVEGTISGVLGGAVKLRVNGGPASLNDLKQIDPKMVRRVEYHDMPSMRYGKVEAVIDLYVKRQEFGGSGRINAGQVANSLSGSGDANLKLYHSKSEFSFWGSGGYQRYKGYTKETVTYNFEDASVITRDKEWYNIRPGSNDSYSGGIGYSYLNPDDVLFTAKLSYSGSPHKSAMQGDIRMDGQSNIKVQIVENRLTKSPRLGLYFQKNLEKKQFVAFEVAGSYTHTNSYYTYNEQQENATLADILSDVDGDTYSIVAEGIYEKRFKTNKLSAGINHRLSYVDNVYEGTTEYKSKFNSYNTYGYAEWMGRFKKLDYSLAVRGTFNQIVQGDEKTLNKNLGATWRLGYRPNQKLQVRYFGETYMTVPSLRTLNNVEQAINAYEIRRGNPNVKKATIYTNTLIFNHKCTSDFWYTLNINDVYTVHPQLSTTFRESGKFITQELNGKSYHQMHFSGITNWHIFNRQLRLYLRMGYKFVRERGNAFSYFYHTCYSEAGGEWTFLKNASLTVGFEKEKDLFNDEQIIYGNRKVHGGIAYFWKKWYFMGFVQWRLRHSYAYWAKSTNPYVVNNQRHYVHNSKNQIVFKVGRNFKFGRQRKSVDQRIENGGEGSAVF